MTGLSKNQIDQFLEDGYLQLDGLLQMDDLNPVIWEFEGVIDREARGLKARGDLTNLHECEPFDRRIALLAAQVPGIASDRVRWSIDLRYQDPAQPTAIRISAATSSAAAGTRTVR